MLSLFKNRTIASGTASNRIYLDYASITPVDPEVVKIVSKISYEFPANPSSLYKEGVAAAKSLAESRKSIAQCLDVHPDEIVFTSGGTESNNLIIQGVLDGWRTQSQADAQAVKPHIISSTIEHPSIRELLVKLSAEDLCDVTYIGVDSRGIVDHKDVQKALRPETILVTIMYVNNEVGTIQPIYEIAKAVRMYKKNNGRGGGDYPYVHTDACQAALYCPLRILSLGVDSMTLDGSKMYGPRSVGILYIKRQLHVSAQSLGGSQEKDRRAGTENVATAAGLAYSLIKAQREREQESIRIKTLRDGLLSELLCALPSLTINGDPEHRVPSNINICLRSVQNNKEIDAEFVVLKLDAKGVCVSSVTSCRSMKEDSSSYVIEAMGMPECARSSLRITLGRYTTAREIKRAGDILISTLTGML